MKAKSMHVEFRNGVHMFLGDYFPNEQLLRDTVEDSVSPQELQKELNKIAVDYRSNWVLDRLSEDKIRYKLVDKLGNIDYFIIDLEPADKKVLTKRFLLRDWNDETIYAVITTEENFDLKGKIQSLVNQWFEEDSPSSEIEYIFERLRNCYGIEIDCFDNINEIYI